MKIATTLRLSLTCQSHGLTIKRLLIVCFIHESKNVLKRSKYHVSHSLRMWKTTLVLNTVENTLNAEDIKTNSGIFSGDFLFPILFYVTLTPHSKILNKNINLKIKFKLPRINVFDFASILIKWLIYHKMSSKNQIGFQ